MTPTELFHEAYAAGIPYGLSDDILRERGEEALRAEIDRRKRADEPSPAEVTAKATRIAPPKSDATA